MYYIKVNDDIFQLLDDHLVQLSVIKTSKYVTTITILYLIIIKNYYFNNYFKLIKYLYNTRILIFIDILLVF